MKPIIQVCGDATVDWISVLNPDQIEAGGVYFWLSSQSIPKVSLGSQQGGSALISEYLTKLIGDKAQVQGVSIDQMLLREPMSSSISSSWTVWRGYADSGRAKPSFRLCGWQGFEPGEWNYAENRLTGKADLLVIEDSGIGFRYAENGWPECLELTSQNRPEQVILKLASYSNRTKENPLLGRIEALGLSGKTTVVTAISDLRACSVRIGASLSWEKIFDEIVAAVYSPVCPFTEKNSGRLLFDRVIVSVGCAGAVIVSRDGSSLVFDRSGQEDDFARRHEGSMIGYNTCMMASLAARWTEEKNNMNWEEAVLQGIALARFLDIEGYDVLSIGGRNSLKFPVDTLVKHHSDKHAGVQFADPFGIWNLGIYKEASHPQNRGDWSILEETVKAGYSCGGGNSAQAICSCAKVIVTKGPKAALPDIPIETVGFWRSADRQEIEGVRSVGNAFRDYLKKKNQETPLCIGVFGPPGAGKSFAIKEIAKGLGIGKDAQLTFNLSQFETVGDLVSAFHQIRDLHLKGKTPLVFWDEFDTPFDGKLLGWLRYFLAPMQDGEFTEQGRTHPVGGGIYVFAGATRHSFAEFQEGATPEELAAKKPDFISRLKAYIDVKGPNGNPNTLEDKYHIIRRAFLLNHFFETYAKNIKSKDGLQIENGVLEAFLNVRRYTHGSRSMETLVKMSSLSGKRRYELSSLPPDQVLSMHVCAEEFLSLANSGDKAPLRIGVTGHIRLNPAQVEALQNTLEQAITFINRAYQNCKPTVLSMMALGADTLVTRVLSAEDGFSLIAVLPASVNEFANDFGSTDAHHENYLEAEHRQEFFYWMTQCASEVIELPSSPTRNDAYAKAGFFIAEHSDLMIAVWDGQDARGKGGTAEVVAHAILCGKPVCHIWADNHKEPAVSSELVKRNLGNFRHINFPGFDAGSWVE